VGGNFAQPPSGVTGSTGEVRRGRAPTSSVLCNDHPDVAVWLNNLAVLLNTQGKPNEACVYGRQVLAIPTRELGSSHPKTQQYRQIGA
jgi:hypothetical protein